MSRNVFKRTLVGAPLAVATAMTLAACGSGGGGGGAGGDVLTIGVPYPQTGGYAEYGSNFSDGVRLAVQQVNDAGGIDVAGTKVQVEAVFCDTQVDTAKAAACGRRLSAQEQAPVMVISTSAETFPILAFNETGRDPFLVISSSASNKLVTEGNELVARYWFNTHSYMPDFTALLKEGLAAEGLTGQTVAIMQSEDEFGQAWNATFTDGWEAQGEEVVGHASFAIGATDFYPQLTALLESDPDFIAMPGVCAQVAPIANQARELGFAGKFIFQISCGPGELAASVPVEELVGSVFEGSSWDAGSPVIEEFRTSFEEEFGREAVIIAADGYAQAMWAINAADEADDVSDPQAIRAALGTALDGDWNILEMRDLEESGETTTTVHPRIFRGADDIVDFRGKS
jgi:branched-chain amino acid transport system substrate-binding protein